MKNKWMWLWPLFFVAFTAYAEIQIRNLVTFGDSLTDDGFNNDGGFGRYSNGYVWPEYMSLKLCAGCLENDAWGGARTDFNNYYHLDWSGLLWQLKEFKMASKPEETLFIIWAGANDLIDGNGDPQVSAHNLLIAVQTLISKGAQYIVVVNLPNITLAPAFNNPKVLEYAQFSPLKTKVKNLVDSHNKNLADLITEKQKTLAQDHANVTLKLIDFGNFFELIYKSQVYDNVTDVWSGTYKYPLLNGYLWWDAFLPMTSVHKRIADHILIELQRDGMVLVDK